MIIRSQDKTRITDDLNLHIFIHDYKSTDECYEIQTSTCATIGEYSTIEKAIKVLDMIQQKYLEYSSSSGGSINQYSAIPPPAFIPPKVFQMPQDSEV